MSRRRIPLRHTLNDDVESAEELVPVRKRHNRYPDGDYSVEVPDPTELERPLGWSRPPTMEERLRMFIRGEALAQRAAELGKESFADADDFDVDDEEAERFSGFEVADMIDEVPPADLDSHVEKQIRERFAPAKPNSDEPPVSPQGPSKAAEPPAPPVSVDQHSTRP